MMIVTKDAVRAAFCEELMLARFDERDAIDATACRLCIAAEAVQEAVQPDVVEATS